MSFVDDGEPNFSGTIDNYAPLYGRKERPAPHHSGLRARGDGLAHGGASGLRSRHIDIDLLPAAPSRIR